MKLSKYTFLFGTDEKEYYAYNTLSNALIKLDEESYAILQRLKGDAQVSKTGLDKEAEEDLYNNTILTDSDEDDFLKYKASITRLRSQRASMHLTLAPTMDCCFKCPYCFEKHKEQGYMTPEVMDSIIKFVSSYRDLKYIKLTWFGGEPLMAVRQIEEFYDKFIPGWKGGFDSNIITTGYL